MSQPSNHSRKPLVEPATSLISEERLRYSRHTILTEIGEEGQRRLKASKVLVVGLGGLGSPLALYLAAAGVGTLGLVDFDKVDVSNLHRQILHGDASLGEAKLDSARRRLSDVNPHVQLVAHPQRLTSANALEVAADYDVVVDGTDNFATRYLVNDACVLLGKPNVYGSIFRFEGQASVFWPPQGPCYRCLYPEPPPPGLVPSCAEGGVLGILPGIIGTIQATEIVKLILGVGRPLLGRLVLYDALEMRFREVKIKRDPQCPLCGESPTITELIDYEQFCQTGASSSMSQPTPIPEMTCEELKERLDAGSAPFILDVRQPEEYAVCKLEESTLIPLGDLPSRINELDPDQEMVVHCKMGGRSAQAVEYLKQQGFSNVANLVGGILAWAERIDRSMPQY